MIDWNTLVAPKNVAPREGQSRVQSNAWGYKPAVSMSDEFRRVAALPRRPLELDGSERAEAIIDQMTERYARVRPVGSGCRCAELQPDKHAEEGCITRLRLPQAQALREIGICGGLLGPIGVGHGKTLIDLLAALAFRVYDPKMTTFVLLVPANLIVQLIDDYRYYGQHFKMPQLVVHGTDYSNTCAKMDPYVVLERGAPIVHVTSYTRVSRPEATVWLQDVLKPDGIIADECHKLRNYKSAGGGRVFRYMQDIAPNTKFAGMSGSITSRTIKDYWHLSKWALRGASPVPTNENDVDDWRRALDPGDNPADGGPLLTLCEPGEHLYDGFRRRVAETMGVVTTNAPAIDAELIFEERDPGRLPPLVKQYLHDLKGSQVRPDGEELLTSLEQAACAIQLACGFYYRWIYPKCEFPRDDELVKRWKAWRKEFFREIRAKLKNPEEHMDSPRLLMNAAERHYGIRAKHKGLPTWASETILPWYEVKQQVYAESEAVWFDDYLLNDAIAWSREHNGIIWYEHATVGQRLSDLSGLPVFGAGKDAKAALLGDQRRGIPGERGDRAVICSIKACSVGTNGLQHRFHEALLLNPMADPNGWEQLLGRLHRPGQPHDQVYNYFYRHTPELRRHIDSAIRAAYYVEGTGFGHQKILRQFPFSMDEEYE